MTPTPLNNLSMALQIMGRLDRIEDVFFMLQVIRRKKDVDDHKNHSSIVKTYYIHDTDYLLSRWDEIVALCEAFQARAMLRVVPRHYKQVAFKTLAKLSDLLGANQFKTARKAYDSAAGATPHHSYRMFIVDLDGGREAAACLADKVMSAIDNICGDRIIAKLAVPSPNGLHLVVSPFDTSKLSATYPEIDIHKDGMTNVYVPASIMPDDTQPHEEQ